MFHPEVNLKKEVAAVVGTTNTATFADVGQRIATLMKYVSDYNAPHTEGSYRYTLQNVALVQSIGPEWMSANLAVLVFRALGMSKEAVACVKVALKVTFRK